MDSGKGFVMAISTDVFARKEIKYRLTAEQFSKLRAIIKTKLQPADFAEGLVSSLYYDTPEFSFIERSLDHPLYKEKLRIRVYGTTFESDTPAFIEIKKKFKGIVYKRRVKMTLAAAQAFLQGEDYVKACLAHPLADADEQAHALEERSRQIAREIASFMEHRGNLLPAMYIVCNRESYIQVDEDDAQTDPSFTRDLRITFDTNLQALPYPASMESAGRTSADRRTPVIPDDEAIMEVKCTGALPLWLVAALDETCSYKQSFSKYGTAYLQMAKRGA